MWTNAVAKVSEFSNACHFDLVDKKGNFLIGLYQASFKALIIKSYERLEKGVYILYSNIVTGWEKKGGKVVGTYAPIQYIKLESGLPNPNKDYIPDKYQLVYLNEQPYYKFNDITEIKFWLSNMGNDVIHNIIVHFAFSKIEQQD